MEQKEIRKGIEEYAINTVNLKGDEKLFYWQEHVILRTFYYHYIKRMGYVDHRDRLEQVESVTYNTMYNFKIQYINKQGMDQTMWSMGVFYKWNNFFTNGDFVDLWCLMDRRHPGVLDLIPADKNQWKGSNI